MFIIAARRVADSTPCPTRARERLAESLTAPGRPHYAISGRPPWPVVCLKRDRNRADSIPCRFAHGIRAKAAGYGSLRLFFIGPGFLECPGVVSPCAQSPKSFPAPDRQA